MRTLDLLRSACECAAALAIRTATLVCALISSSCLHSGAQDKDCRLVIIDSEGWESSCVSDAGGSEYLLPPCGVSNSFHSVVGLGERGVAIKARDEFGQVTRVFPLPVQMRYYDLAARNIAFSPGQSCAAWLDPSSRIIMVLDVASTLSMPISREGGNTNASIYLMEWVDDSVLIVAWSSGVVMRYSRDSAVTESRVLDFDWTLLRHALSPNRKYIALASRRPNSCQVVSIFDVMKCEIVTNVTTTSRRDVMSLVWDVDSCGLLYTLGDSLYGIDLSGSERLIYRHNVPSQGALFAECVTVSSVILTYCSSGKHPQDSRFIFDRKTGGVMPMRADSYTWQAIPGTSKLVYRTGP